MHEGPAHNVNESVGDIRGAVEQVGKGLCRSRFLATRRDAGNEGTRADSLVDPKDHRLSPRRPDQLSQARRRHGSHATLIKGTAITSARPRPPRERPHGSISFAAFTHILPPSGGPTPPTAARRACGPRLVPQPTSRRRPREEGLPGVLPRHPPRRQRGRRVDRWVPTTLAAVLNHLP